MRNVFFDLLPFGHQKLEKQMHLIIERIENVENKEGVDLPEIKSLQDKMDSRGINNNPHTLLNFKDVDVQFQQYREFLVTKRKQIEEDISHKLNRGVSTEQMDEINKQFVQYDKNGNKVLDSNEFKACLYSLGYDSDMLTLKRIMKQHGGKETEISYEGFKAFMIAQLGDSDTKEEILSGFKMINKGGDEAQEQLLSAVLPDETVNYIKENAPPARDKPGFDYVSLVEELYKK